MRSVSSPGVLSNYLICGTCDHTALPHSSQTRLSLYVRRQSVQLQLRRSLRRKLLTTCWPYGRLCQRRRSSRFARSSERCVCIRRRSCGASCLTREALSSEQDLLDRLRRSQSSRTPTGRSGVGPVEKRGNKSASLLQRVSIFSWLSRAANSR